MIQATKKLLNNKKHRNIAILSILCIAAIGLSVWIVSWKDIPNDTSVVEDSSPEAIIVLGEDDAPLSSFPGHVSVGDIVVVNIFADEMDNVYGYQFDINYNREYLEYRKRIYSEIEDMIAIFATDKEQYLLVGATMIGDAKGYSGQDIPVCRVEFVALSDFDLENDFDMKYIMLSRVNVVTDDLQYLEDIDGWAADLSIQ